MTVQTFTPEETRHPLSLVFLLDTPNLWGGTAIAGTPARILALATALRRLGCSVHMVLCDRGLDQTDLDAFGVPGVLVHPSVYYGPPAALAGLLAEFDPDLLIVTDAEQIAMVGQELARRLGAGLLYEAHDDEAGLALSLGEPATVIERRRRWQRAAVTTADFVTALTDRDTATFLSYGARTERLMVLPTGCEPAERTVWGPDSAARRLLFLGNLHYQPNARAVGVVADVVGRLLARGVDIRARIVGRGPGELTVPRPGLEFRGPVIDTDPECAGVSLAVAPLVAGSGMKMKMLTYLAAGLPVLATSEAVVGLPADHPGVVVEDDLTSWPDLIQQLLGDTGRLAALGTAGRACVAGGYAWECLAARALQQFTAWRAMPRVQAAPVSIPDGAAEPLWLAEHRTQNALGAPQLTRNKPAVAFSAIPACDTAASTEGAT